MVLLNLKEGIKIYWNYRKYTQWFDEKFFLSKRNKGNGSHCHEYANITNKKCFENYGYTLCPWWPEEIFRLSNWLMMFHCVWTSKELLFFMHWFTFWFCHLQVFFMYDVFALWYLSVQVFDFSSSCTQHQNRADTTQSFLRPKENYTLQVSQIRPIKHWNWYFLHWNARQIALIE